MVCVQTKLKVVDNSGAFKALCIGILWRSKRVANIGDTLIISIKAIVINRKVTHQKKRKVIKGSVQKSVLLRMVKPLKRCGSFWLRGGTNSVAIVGSWNLPIGNRISGPIFFEVKDTKFSKFTMLGEGII